MGGLWTYATALVDQHDETITPEVGPHRVWCQNPSVGRGACREECPFPFSSDSSGARASPFTRNDLQTRPPQWRESQEPRRSTASADAAEKKGINGAHYRTRLPRPCTLQITLSKAAPTSTIWLTCRMACFCLRAVDPAAAFDASSSSFGGPC